MRGTLIKPAFPIAKKKLPMILQHLPQFDPFEKNR